jgi:hypothetical protein
MASPADEKDNAISLKIIGVGVARCCCIFVPNTPIWVNLAGLGIDNIGIFYCRLEYFGNFLVIRYIFTPFWYNLVSRKIWQS